MRLLFIIILFAIIFCQSLLIGQNLSNPIQPATQPKPMYLGVTFGLGQNFQSGLMYVECPGCVFENGTKFGFNVGLLLEKFIIEENLLIGLDLLYNDNGVKSSYIENERVEVSSETVDYKENVLLPFRHAIDADIQSFLISPYLKYQPFSFLFLKLGFGYNVFFSSNLKHDKELLKRIVTLSNGTIVNVKIPGEKDYIATVQDGEYPQLQSGVISLMPSVGFNIPFDEKKNVIFSPWFAYNMPMSNISDNGNELKINFWRIMFSISFKL